MFGKKISLPSTGRRTKILIIILTPSSADVVADYTIPGVYVYDAHNWHLVSRHLYTDFHTMGFLRIWWCRDIASIHENTIRDEWNAHRQRIPGCLRYFESRTDKLRARKSFLSGKENHTRLECILEECMYICVFIQCIEVSVCFAKDVWERIAHAFYDQYTVEIQQGYTS